MSRKNGKNSYSLLTNPNKKAYFDVIGYKPEQIQWDVHNSKARFRVNIQGRRSGKSYSASREAEVAILQPNTRGWIVAPSYELASKIGREIHENLIIKYKFPTISKKVINGNLFYAKFINGSEVWVKSAGTPDTSLVGEGLDWLIIDESAIINKLVWEQYLRPTLSDRQGWALFVSTPRGYNWLYDLYQRGQSNDYPEWESWQHSSSTSRYFRDNIEELRNELTEETFRQEYLAEFTSFAGKVYPIEREVHIKKLSYQKEWETYCAVDFGYRQPAVVWLLVGKVDGDFEVHIIDEIAHKTNIKTEELIQLIKQKNYPVLKTYCDPAGVGVQSTSGLGDAEIFRRNGIGVNYKTDRISRSIPSGIDLVRSFFKNAEGKARLFISDKCTNVINDFENYRYPDKRENQRLKEEPLKDGHHDHSMDAIRYFFINRFPIRKKEVQNLQRIW